MLSLLPVLGIQAFESVRGGDLGQGAPRVMFTLRTAGCEATGFPTNEGFAVCAGSRARLETVPSMAVHVPNYLRIRETLIAEDFLVQEDDHYVLQADYSFPSPTQAAAIFMGRNANGPREWKGADGKTLREHQQAEASQ
jgi:5-methylcytosine-specific restriction protein B